MIADAVHDVVGFAGLSDSAKAHAFATRSAEKFRFVPSLGWFVWNGYRWQSDTARLHRDAARLQADDLAMDAVCDATVPPTRKAGVVKDMRSARSIQAMLYLAEAHPALVVLPEQLDAQAYVLATPGGEVDLRDGSLVPSRRESFCTKCTTVAPSDQVPHAWLVFLKSVTGGNAELIQYLQRVAGYALLGVKPEHALVFLYGLGANGKSTFVNTLAGVLGDYAQVAPMDTFTETSGSQHPTDLAMLRGARLVTASETEDGKRWNAPRIKQITGGDPIAARLMRQDFFEYIPQFLLLFSGNHKPGLRSMDEGIRRRMHLVPFTVTIPAEKRDHNLPMALRDEWPAILRWMIDGCLAWQRQGLSPPAAVTAATEAYLSDEDVLGQWLEQATDQEADTFETATALHDDYRAWADRNAEKFLGAKRFGQALEDRGMKRHRSNAARGFTGRRLKTMGERPWNRRSQPGLLD